MKKLLAFDDVLLVPKFNYVESRADVNLESNFLGFNLRLPIFSANMDSISESKMAAVMSKAGGVGCLHRFQDVASNVKMFDDSVDLMAQNHYPVNKPFVSVGLGSNEFERAIALEEAGATHFVIDVAHGASMAVVKQYDRLRGSLKTNAVIVVGNFANAQSIKDFNHHVKSSKRPDAFKAGIGGGSVCSTRIVTGCGAPTFGSVLDCVSAGFDIIADGGIRSSGDIAKCLGAGAKAVMIGSLLAGTDETPGESVWLRHEYKKVKYSDQKEFFGTNLIDEQYNDQRYKKYRGSASSESYQSQGKEARHRAPEGESHMVPYKGAALAILDQLEAGVRSAFTYVGASDLTSFRENAEFVEITSSGATESKPHGVK